MTRSEVVTIQLSLSCSMETNHWRHQGRWTRQAQPRQKYRRNLVLEMESQGDVGLIYDMEYDNKDGSMEL